MSDNDIPIPLFPYTLGDYAQNPDLAIPDGARIALVERATRRVYAGNVKADGFRISIEGPDLPDGTHLAGRVWISTDLIDASSHPELLVGTLVMRIIRQAQGEKHE